MTRDPSLHVLYSDLIKILEKVGIDEAEKYAKRIMQVGVNYAIKDRYIIAGDNDVRRTAKKIMQASKGHYEITVQKFNRFLTTTRMNIGHKGIMPIRESDITQWNMLRECAQRACEFSELHKLDMENGCLIYIQLGLKLLGRQYSLSRLKSGYWFEEINNLYIATDMVENDPHPEKTEQVYELWQVIMEEFTTMKRELKNVQDKVFMVYVRTDADATGAVYEDWLRAQFERINGHVPDLNQLMGRQAEKRYFAYMADQRVNTKKNGKHIENFDGLRSDFDNKYFSFIRSRYAKDGAED